MAELLLEPASDDEDEVGGRGLAIREVASGGTLRWYEVRLAAHRARVVKVAGIAWRIDEAQGPEFIPGSVLRLVAEPGNPHDRNAVGIWSGDGRTQVGYVPRRDAVWVSRAVSQRRVEAFSLWEWRDEEGRRVGLRVLIAPEGVVEAPAR